MDADSDSKASKLAALVKQGSGDVEPESGQAERELFAEMEAEWEKDWSEL
jgi:hypothetical protein